MRPSRVARAFRLGMGLGSAFLCTASCLQVRGGKPQVLQGFATFGHEVRSFRLCGTEEGHWAIDSSGVLWDLHQELAPGLEPYEEVFASVRGFLGPSQVDGFGADYEGTLVVEEVLYAAREGLGCDTDWSQFSYRALGNEPFWSLDITPETMEINQLGLEKKSWTLTSEGHTGDVGHFTGRAPDGTTIEVDLRSEPCRDSMSGAYYSFSVGIQIEGEELLGCGLRGAFIG